MINIKIINNEIPDIKLLEEIYNDVGWINYTLLPHNSIKAMDFQ